MSLRVDLRVLDGLLILFDDQRKIQFVGLERRHWKPRKDDDSKTPLGDKSEKKPKGSALMPFYALYARQTTFMRSCASLRLGAHIRAKEKKKKRKKR